MICTVDYDNIIAFFCCIFTIQHLILHNQHINTKYCNSISFNLSLVAHISPIKLRYIRSVSTNFPYRIEATKKCNVKKYV